MAFVNNWEKFTLLLWKNWILQWNHKIQLLIELCLPVVFALLLVLVRSLVIAEQMPVTEYPPLDISNLNLFYTSLDRAIQYQSVRRVLKSKSMSSQNLVDRPLPDLVYSPENPYFDAIVKDAAASLKLRGYKAFPNASAMEDQLNAVNYFAGVQFDDALYNITDYPQKLSYTLRFPSELRTAAVKLGFTWLTNKLFLIMDTTGPRNPNSSDGSIPVGYLREGFTPVQHAVSMSYMKLASKETQVLPEVVMQRYPYPPYIYDPLLEGLASMMPLIILLCFIYPCTNITKYITAEKEKQLKEVMKIMGLQNYLHWLAWFVKAFVMLAISSIFIVLFLKLKFADDVAVLTYSAYGALLFFMFVYIATSIVFCFMLATFFSKASTAAAVTGLVWFIAYLPYTFMFYTYDQLTLAEKLSWCLVSNTAMGFGFKVIMALEGTGEGLQWNNFFQPISVDDNLCLGYVIIMMIISMFIYFLLCLYIEQIFPGDFGVPKKWYFPFTASFWCGESDYIGVEDSNGSLQHRNPDAFEPEPTGKHIGLQVKNLKKRFGDKMAVKGLSVNMYEDEITVLLGHNGAGKTTTISMLTGMFPPTAGTAIINGSDIRSNIEGARMSLGICPQHNVLFDDMSVSDHLVFFSRMKGLKGDAIKREVNKYLKMIELENKANVASSKLSGGMKRKLSVCCALCGDTKVVLCDEPSSGMDPAARRQLWDLLQAEKTGRTVLLTTHFMDEADVLGDRIAIMCDGELKCHGTSFFLKKKYGSGYRLICVKQENCEVAHISGLLGKYIPEIQPEADIGAELSYQLPDNYAPIFEEMLSDLEDNCKDLNLNGYGIGITSLEEVFMKVGAENAPDGARKDQNAVMNGGTGYGDDDIESTQSESIFTENKRLVKGMDLFLNQWKAMFIKKILYTWRNKLLFFLQNFLPIFFVTVIVLLTRNQGFFSTLPPMTVGLTQYPTAVSVLDVDTSVPNDSFEAQVASQYTNIANSYGSNYGYTSTGNLSFSEYILQLGESIQVRINSRYLAAATVAKGRITAWLNNQPLHTAPLTLNMVHNAMAKVLLGSNCEITVTNYPLPYSPDIIFTQLSTGNNLGSQLAVNLCFCFSFISAFYILFIIKERESRSKLLQFVGGVKVLTFWLTQLLWDLFTFMITTLVLVLTILCFQEPYYTTFVELGRYFLFVMTFGFAVLPATYFAALFFTEPASGFARVSIINIFTGMALFIVVVVMSYELFDTKDAANIMQWVFRVFPHFSFAMGWNKIYINDATRGVCGNPIISNLPDVLRCHFIPQCCTTVPYLAMEDPGILPEVLYLLADGVIFFIIIIIWEFGVFNKVIEVIRDMCFKPPQPSSSTYFDDDVDRERKMIMTMSSNEIAVQNLVLDRVTKYYEKFLAVNQISLCVKRTECFGLLGVNGAGKTTTFKMMTGDEKITHGSAYIMGMSLKTQMATIYKEIGYCPQFDALLDDLTGRELLKIFCLLRGVQQKRINHVSEELAKSFGFMKHIDKETKAYSGGNKRKLSTAIAMIGSPSVIYLDEPTTGMDPAARRQLWNMVCRIRDSGRSIILTSHSMEECEALCTRLAIMVNGEFKCIGSTQHLKNKFSKGLILHIKIRRYSDMIRQSSKTSLTYTEDDRAMQTQVLQRGINNVKEFVDREFPQAILQEEYQGILTFYIPLSSIKWSNMFGLMERNREALNVEDYSISQTSLEEIFLDFAKFQREDPRVLNKKQCCCCFPIGSHNGADDNISNNSQMETSPMQQ